MGFGSYRYWIAPGICDYPSGVNIGPEESYDQRRINALVEKAGKQADQIIDLDRKISYLEKDFKRKIECLEAESNRKIEYLEKELERMKEKYKDCQSKN